MYRRFIAAVFLVAGLAAGPAYAAIYEIEIHAIGPKQANEQFSCSDGEICVGPQIIANRQLVESQATVSPYGITLQFYQSGLLVPVNMAGAQGADNTLVIPVDAMHGSLPVRKRLTLTLPNVANPPSYAGKAGAERLTGRARPVDIQATIRKVAP